MTKFGLPQFEVLRIGAFTQSLLSDRGDTIGVSWSLDDLDKRAGAANVFN